MHQRLKERLVGAAVLVVIAVIFIPMILTGPVDSTGITKTNIPERPAEKFESKLVPISEPIKPIDSDVSLNLEQKEKTIDDVADATGQAGADIKSEKVAEKQTGTKTSRKDKQVGLSAWVVQLGSFSSKVNADKLNLSLRKAGFPAFVEPLTKDKKTVYRVRVGPEILRSDADKLLKQIKSKSGKEGIVLSYP